jgi:hypothetical protein
MAFAQPAPKTTPSTNRLDETQPKMKSIIGYAPPIATSTAQQRCPPPISAANVMPAFIGWIACIVASLATRG